MAEPVYKVVITPRAEASLEKILDYLAEEVSLQTALKVRDKLEEAIRSLAKMPQRNTILTDISSGAKISDHFSRARGLDKTLEMKRLLI